MDSVVVLYENAFIIKRAEIARCVRACVFFRFARPEGIDETAESIKKLPDDART